MRRESLPAPVACYRCARALPHLCINVIEGAWLCPACWVGWKQRVEWLRWNGTGVPATETLWHLNVWSLGVLPMTRYLETPDA